MAQGQRDLKLGVLLGEHLECRRLHVVRADLDERQALLPGQQLAELPLLKQAALDEDLAEPPPGAHPFPESVFELLLAKQARAEDERAERHVDHRSGRPRSGLMSCGGNRRRLRGNGLGLGLCFLSRRRHRVGRIGEERSVRWFG